MSNTYKFNVQCGIQNQIIIGGQYAQSLIALIKSGINGIKVQEMSSWALKLASYVHRLRHDFGLHIETVRNSHEVTWGKGNHVQYILHTDVEIIGPVEQV